MNVLSLFRASRADEPAKGWHTSPAVDVAAYAFSWAWVLVPLLLAGDQTEDYLFIYLLVLGATGIHRHFGLPYVYLDGQVRRAYPLRFTLFPAVLFVAWVASPWLSRQDLVVSVPDIIAGTALIALLLLVLRRDGTPHAIRGRSIALTLIPAAIAVLAIDLTFPTREDAGGLGGVPIRPLLDGVALFAGVWNVWHVYMQKYGIFRMYSAKSAAKEKVPGAVDRFFVLSWLPLYFAWIGPHYKDTALDQLGGEDGILARLIDVLVVIEPVAVPVGFATVALAMVLWVRAEWRSSRLRSAPRLTMALGTTALAASFLLFDPIKVYLAFGFSHAVEYMVFVWAFQRKRYGTKLPHDPLLGRVLRWPWLAYGGFALVVGAVFLGAKFYGTYLFPGSEQPEVLGAKPVEWARYWGIYQSMVHFYFDGFLWKMRLPSVRASL